MNTRRCQVFRNTCVISENLLHVFSPHKALYCVKWYANPAGTELSVRSCAPSCRHRCVHAVCRGSTCCSVSQRHNEGGLKSPFQLFSQGGQQNICVIFLFPVLSIQSSTMRFQAHLQLCVFETVGQCKRSHVLERSKPRNAFNFS